MTSTPSTINDLIKNQNPFAGHTVVRPQQIWGKSFPDVPSINAHASDAVFQAVEQVRKGQRETVGITITAERGLGKSHLISRIRHRLQTEDTALFVYMSKYDNLNQSKYQFLQAVATSLRAFGGQKVMQWQELAAALINDAKKLNYTPQQYLSFFPGWLTKYSTKIVDHFVDSVLQIKPDITNPYIVRAMIWTLHPTYANYATYWLSGLELTPNLAEGLGLPNPNTEERETEAFSMVRQILDITCDYRVPVICFDELDIVGVDDNGYTAAQVTANFAKELFNNLKSGVLLLAMYSDTWKFQVRVLPQAEAVMDRLGVKPIDLNYLNSDDVVTLVSQWLKEFYEENQQTPPHPLYPFDEGKLRKFGGEKPFVRSVLKWCAENFAVGIVDPIVENPVEPYFKNELENLQAADDLLLEDTESISNALWLGFCALEGETVEGVTIEDVTEFDKKPCHLDFKVVGRDKGKAIKIGIAILQVAGGIGVQATINQLTQYSTFGITRGCLVRSKKIGANAAKARNFLKILLEEKGGEWVKLQLQDIKPLLAIRAVYDICETYDLTEDQVFDFINEKQIAANNPLIREILSDPSGQEPANLTDDDLPMRIPQATSNNFQELSFTK